MPLWSKKNKETCMAISWNNSAKRNIRYSFESIHSSVYYLLCIDCDCADAGVKTQYVYPTRRPTSRGALWFVIRKMSCRSGSPNKYLFIIPPHRLIPYI